MTINRGGSRISIVKATAHHVPPITVGHLDQKGQDLLDEMLKGSQTVDEIVEFFESYVNEDYPIFCLKSTRSRQQSRQASEEPADIPHLRDLSDQLKRVKKHSNQSQKQTSNFLNAPSRDSANSKQNNIVLNTDTPEKDTKTEIDTFEEEDNMEDLLNENQPKTNEIQKPEINANLDKLNKRKYGKTNIASNETKNGTTIESTNNVTKLDSNTNHQIKTNISFGIEQNKTTVKKKKNVFDILDADYVKRTIPYMHPDTKKHTFRFFKDKVHEVVDGKGLFENDILDVMEFRMGGSYLAEMKQLRGQKWDLDYIENYYLQKDIDMENDRKKKKELIEKSAKVKNTLHLNSITNFSTPG